MQLQIRLQMADLPLNKLEAGLIYRDLHRTADPHPRMSPALLHWGVFYDPVCGVSFSAVRWYFQNPHIIGEPRGALVTIVPVSAKTISHCIRPCTVGISGSIASSY